MAGEWRDVALGEVLELKRGYDLPQKDRSLGKVPLVSSSGVTDRHAVSMAKGPGVVTGRYGTLGKVFYIREDFWPLNTTLYVRDFKGNNPRFISYFLSSLDFLAYSDKAAVPGLNRNDLHQARVRLPANIDEQRTIAHILGTLDDKIELNRRMNETLEAMARALFKSWFVDFDPVRAKHAQSKVEGAEGRPSTSSGQAFPGLPKPLADLFPDSFENTELGEIPKGWRVGSILDTARLLSGGTPKTDRDEYWSGAIPWASAKDVSQCGDSFLVETERKITERGLAESATQMIPALCSVVVARGATTGRMVVLGDAMAMNQTCYALATAVETPFALYCQLRQEIGNLVHAAHGSVFDTITTSTFATSKVVLPPRSVLKGFEVWVEPLFRRILDGTKASHTLAILRGALLPKLISGELRINQAEQLIGVLG